MIPNCQLSRFRGLHLKKTQIEGNFFAVRTIIVNMDAIFLKPRMTFPMVALAPTRCFSDTAAGGSTFSLADSSNLWSTPNLCSMTKWWLQSGGGKTVPPQWSSEWSPALQRLGQELGAKYGYRIDLRTPNQFVYKQLGSIAPEGFVEERDEEENIRALFARQDGRLFFSPGVLTPGISAIEVFECGTWTKAGS